RCQAHRHPPPRRDRGKIPGAGLTGSGQMGDCVRAMSRASVLVMKDNERQCVLVVDDNPLTRKVVRATLEAGGYVVREAQDGQSALAIMAHHSPALILQDLLLPDMGGFELVTRLRALPGGAQIPILAFSGLTAK